jgi:unsaturated rhamnogalacturonyl hydrolase
MKTIKNILLLLICSGFIHSNADPISRKSVLTIAEKVANWQLSNLTTIDWWTWPSDHQYGQYLLDWENGAFYSGLMDLYKVDPKKKYLTSMIDMGKKYRWNIRPRLWDANVLCIGQMYVDLYMMKKKPEMIEMIGFCLNAYFDRHPTEPDVTFKNNRYWFSWWSWCDALYMAPPTFTKYAKATGRLRYLDKMDELYTITYNYLYDKDEKLFFRDDRFFTQLSPAGKKIFWARGNGWVIAGLVKVLQSMPKDYPRVMFYENLFKEMCSRFKEIQQPEGYWTSSLLDATQSAGVETSGTGFICYALAWGINNGYLNRDEYLPVVEKGWELLVKSIHPDGKLGYVQKPGDSPESVSFDTSFPYGVGAFLSAASEVAKFSN